MSVDPHSVALRDGAAELALAAICRGEIDIAPAATALLAAAAVLVALQPEGEWRDFLNEAWALMPDLVRHHAARFEAAGIVASRGSIQ